MGLRENTAGNEIENGNYNQKIEGIYFCGFSMLVRPDTTQRKSRNP